MSGLGTGLFDRIGFLIGEAMIAMRRNLTMTFAAVITAAVALYLIGGLAYVYLRMSEYANSLTGRFEMRVILRDGATPDAISATANTIRQLDGVSGVYWIPRDTAWKADQSKYPELTEGVEN